MKKMIKKIINIIGFNVVPYSSQLKKLFGNSIPPKDEFTINHATGTISFHKLSLTLPLDKYLFFCKNYKFARLLSSLCGARFYFSDDDLLCSVQGITIFIETGQDISTLREVYVKGCYNVESPEDFILIDIGLNVGITSLYFSENDKCKKIYSFEPIEETYKQAQKNISINANASKINTFNYGLGSQERVIEIEYDASIRGSVGINGLPPFADKSKHYNKTNLQIKNVSNVLESIFDEFFNKNNIFIKIDCEGAEYEILDDLRANNLLDKASCILIEWHEKGPTRLIENLQSAGFKTLSLDSHDTFIGALFAFK
jgi:FkbM family methyltransferase